MSEQEQTPEREPAEQEQTPEQEPSAREPHAHELSAREPHAHELSARELSEQRQTPGQEPPEQEQTVGDALAERVEASQGPTSPWARALREMGAVDRAVYEAVARTATPTLDDSFRRLSNAANYSRLWLGIAAGIALFGSKRGRSAAVEGVLAIGVTSATINLCVKPLARRHRPDITATAQFGSRRVRMPESTSFPSGHAASAFAFAYAVGRHLPGLAVPIRLLAGGVAYSRVHTGVHYPGDVAIGSILGAGTAAMTATVVDRLPELTGRVKAPDER
jgi:membrane-associated phospholipid phosphatase